MSNFGEVECEHNLGYWSGRPYLGLGPGAHSRLGLGETRIAMVYDVIMKKLNWSHFITSDIA